MLLKTVGLVSSVLFTAGLVSAVLLKTAGSVSAVLLTAGSVSAMLLTIAWSVSAVLLKTAGSVSAVFLTTGSVSAVLLKTAGSVSAVLLKTPVSVSSVLLTAGSVSAMLLTRVCVPVDLDVAEEVPYVVDLSRVSQDSPRCLWYRETFLPSTQDLENVYDFKPFKISIKHILLVFLLLHSLIQGFLTRGKFPPGGEWKGSRREWKARKK